MKQINLSSQLLESRKLWTTLILEENESVEVVDFLENIKPVSSVNIQVKINKKKKTYKKNFKANQYSRSL